MDRIENHPILGETPKEEKKLHSAMMENYWKDMRESRSLQR